MKRSLLMLSALLIASTILVSLPASVSNAATGLPVTTTTFALTISLHQCTLTGLPCVVANYRNNATSTILGVVYVVVQNSLSQTLYYSTATLNLNAGQNAPAYLLVNGLPKGNYTATVFVTNANNTAISTSSSLLIIL